ncbi:hypothetical protein FN846DRAFT_959208 [Sphaerosporella brunnea]|uniref:F-box domain-containing protein n=1 Tax=Sphaerosporella brunnea TaxID=1250544 RepID=A0A5J5ERH6_9PEZI|nr:hypothetical protein FN846DRAFT_959208 [Sphaerosporella brunnea]
MASRPIPPQDHRNYTYGPNPAMGPISMAPVVPPEPIDGNELAPYRYGGPRRKHAKQIARAAQVTKPWKGKSIIDVPRDVLCEVFDYLDVGDLKVVALVCKALSFLASSCLYKRYVWKVKGSRNVETVQFAHAMRSLATTRRGELIATADFYHSENMHDTFSLLENLPGLTRLSIRFRDVDKFPHSYNEDQFAAKFPDLLPRLEELNVHPSHGFPELEPILKWTTSLQRLFVAVPYRWQPPGDVFTRDNAISKLVGDQLRELRLGAQEDDYSDYDDSQYQVGSIVRFASLPDVSCREDFPNLKRVEFGEMWICEDDPFNRIKFMIEVWKAHVAHGGWDVKLHDSLEIAWFELIELEKRGLAFSKRFLAWLDKLKGPNDDDILFADDMVHTWEELSAPRILEITDFGMQLMDSHRRFRLKIAGEYPPNSEPQTIATLLNIAPSVTSVTIRPHQFPISETRFGREETIQEAQEVFVQWNDFFKEFFPKCVNMETLRIRSDTTGDGGDIPLGKYEIDLAKLCRRFKLRHLDVDASALTQPETNAGHDIPYTINQEEPYMAIKHLAWISLPDPRSGYNDLKNNLLNLTHLTLHGIFLHRQTEFIWFTNLPAKLKNMVKLCVHGLVWHAGFDRQSAWGGEGDGWEDIDEDEDPFLVHHHQMHYHHHGDYEFQNPPDPNQDAGREQPFDDHDRSMNQALAHFFLNDFEQAMQQKLGLTPENCMQNAQYRMAIASRDAMRGELERRGRDGTVRTQLNPFIHYGFPIPGPPETPDPEEEREDEPEEDDGSDAESTDSGFGTDPRFAEQIDEELRSARLAEWVRQVLLATARRTGSKCRDFEITDVKVDATSLRPWYFREQKAEDWIQTALGTNSIALQYF